MEAQTQTQNQTRIIHAYQGYFYKGVMRVVPPYEWYRNVHELLNIPMHFWGTPLIVGRRFFEVDSHLGVMTPKEWTSFCEVQVLTAPMFYDDMVIKNVDSKDSDYLMLIWKNNSEKWRVIGVQSEYDILNNPPSGVIVGSFIGGTKPPLWSGKYRRITILRVSGKGHDIAPGYSVTDFTCNLFAGLV